MDFERYLLLRKQVEDRPKLGAVEDTPTHFVVVVKDHTLRVPKGKHRVRASLLRSLLKERRDVHRSYLAVRGTYLRTRGDNVDLERRVRETIDALASLDARIANVRSSAPSMFVSERPSDARDSTPVSTPTRDKTVDKLREASRNGPENARRFLFNTYQECVSSASSKPYYMSKNDLLNAIRAHRPELLQNKTVSKLTKKELCTLVLGKVSA
jgi:hypothetical protein